MKERRNMKENKGEKREEGRRKREREKFYETTRPGELVVVVRRGNGMEEGRGRKKNTVRMEHERLREEGCEEESV